MASCNHRQILLLLFICILNFSDGLLWHGQSNISSTTPSQHGNNPDSFLIHQLFATELSNLKSTINELTEKVTSLERNRTQSEVHIKDLQQEINQIKSQQILCEQNFQTAKQDISNLKSSNAYLNSSNAYLNSSNAYLNSSNALCLKRIESMEELVKMVKNDSTKWNDIENILNDLKVQIRYTSLSLLDVNAETNSSLLHINRLLSSFQNSSKSQISILQRNMTSIHKIISDLSIDVREISSNITRRQAEDMLKKVAFTASVSSPSYSWNSGTLVFPVVITNVGNGYNPNNGIFTAPTNGNYVFFVNVQSYTTQDIYVDIVLNGSTKVRTMAYSRSIGEAYDAGPNLVVLTLQKGDTVWVKHHSGKGYWANGSITTFSGFLI